MAIADKKFIFKHQLYVLTHICVIQRTLLCYPLYSMKPNVLLTRIDQKKVCYTFEYNYRDKPVLTLHAKHLFEAQPMTSNVM